MEIPNIFVQNISLQFIEIKNLSEYPYYLFIDTPLGINNTKVELVPHFLCQGEDVSNKVNWRWFKEDLSVIPGSEKFNVSAGSGWAQISDLDSKTLTIS